MSEIWKDVVDYEGSYFKDQEDGDGRMSYDLAIHVKVEGANCYMCIAEPEIHSPTYNLGSMFRACMGWDFSRSENGEDGVYRTVYYKCSEVIQHIEHGIEELHTSMDKYKMYNPPNGWGGDTYSALRALESLRACIYEQAENIPIEALYMTW